MRNSPVPGLLLMLAAALHGDAIADTWVLDAADSRLIFRPTWEGVPFEAEFRRFSGTLVLDASRPDTGRLEVQVDVTSADAGSEDLNEGMAMGEWFALDQYRTAVYVADRIRPSGDGGYVAAGTLTLKGVEHRLDLPFTWSETAEGSVFRAKTQVDRIDWRIGEGEWASGEGIGLQVELEVDALFRHEGAAQ